MKKIEIKYIWSCLFFLLIGTGGFTQSLEEYLELAVENNPKLRAAHVRYEAALEMAPQVGSLPDPTLTGSAFGTPMSTDMGEERASFEVMQMFPWFGTLEARKEVADLKAAAQYQAYVAAREQLFFEVKEAYAELYEAEKIIEFQRENLDILDSYHELAMRKFRNGQSQMVNVVRVEIEQDAARTQIELLEERIAPLTVAFNLLLHRDEGATVQLQDSLKFKNEMLESQLTFEGHPSLLQLEKQQESYEAEKKVSQKEGLPMLGVGVGYMVNAKSPRAMPEMNGQDAIMPMFSVSIPIFRKKYKAMEREAELMAQGVEQDQQLQQNQLRSEYHQQLYELNRADKLLELYQRQLQSSQQARQLLVSSFASNTGDFEEILRMNQDILMYRTQQLEALKTGFNAEARIEYLLTTDPIEEQKN